MRDLGAFLPPDVIRDLGSVCSWDDLSCFYEFMCAEGPVDLGAIRAKYHAEARLRARALLNLRNHGTQIVETYVECCLENGRDAPLRTWEWEDTAKQLEAMRHQNPRLELEWSRDVLERAGFGTGTSSWE